ncbi:MAG: xanthine dehydrogenase family protein subunit M [Chloroflexota bacterium]
MRRFEVSLPTTVDECLKALAAAGSGGRAVAGGTDLVPQMKNGLLRPATVVDLSAVSELQGLSVQSDGSLRIGAGVSARSIELDGAVRRAYSVLSDGAGLVGSIQVRNLATIGGNICNAAPSADMAAPLMVLDAVAVIAGPSGRRRVSLSEFFTGVRRTVLAPGELLVELSLPAPEAGTGGNYRRHTPRQELDIAVVGVASLLTVKNGSCTKARIALASVAPTPIRVPEAEALLTGKAVTPALIEQAADLAAQASRPISDQRGSAEYRRHLVKVLTRRTLTTALERAS